MSELEDPSRPDSDPAASANAGSPEHAVAFRRALLESAHNGIIVADETGRIVLFSPAAERLMGYSTSDVVGKETPALFHDPEELKKRAEEFSRQTGQSLKHPYEVVLAQSQDRSSGLREWTLVRKDGSKFPALISVASLKTDDGSTLGYVGIATDISHQRQTERAWQEQSEFLQIVLDAIPSPIYFKDRRGAYLGCNKAFEEFFGKPRGEIIGKTAHDLFSRDSADIHHAADQQLFNKGGVQRYDSFALDAGGTPREVIFHKAVFERGQTITGLVGAILDITERKQAEEKLRVSEAKYRELVQSANSIILRMDRKGIVTFFNEYAQRFFGFSEEDILGRNVVGTIVPKSDTAGRDLRAMILDIGRHPERYAANENENIKRNGERIWIAWTNQAIHAADGSVAEILCVGNDITHQKSTEAQLQQAKEEAEAANRAKTAFLASMSHEIRTPMTAILGYADLLLHMSPSQRNYARWVRDLRRNCDHLLALLNDVLDLSKIEAGQMELHIEDVHVTTLLEEVVALLRPHADEKGLSFDVHYCSRIPATCRTDALRLRQILLNLSTNAIKFTEKGSVAIEVSTKESDGGAHLLLAVKDTGIGIPEEQLDHLFKPFSQVHFSSRRQYGGTGLGLNISQRLANALGGLIYVESRPDKGSTFTVDLPVRQAQQMEWLETHEIQRSSNPEPPALSRLDGYRILLVEDGPDNQRILSYMLEGAGADVQVAENGAMGVEAFEKATESGTAFDLVLMDIQMPVMDGYEATRTLRAKGITTPIVALTAFAMSGDRESCLAAGCNDYLPKPITTASLLTKLSRYLHAPNTSTTASKDKQEVTQVQSRLADDPRFSALVRDFQADLGQRIMALETAREQNDHETIRTQAHRLKSAAGMLGFDGLSSAAAVCEQAWREERSDRDEMLSRMLKWLRACHVSEDE